MQTRPVRPSPTCFRARRKARVDKVKSRFPRCSLSHAMLQVVSNDGRSRRFHLSKGHSCRPSPRSKPRSSNGRPPGSVQPRLPTLPTDPWMPLLEPAQGVAPLLAVRAWPEQTPIDVLAPRCTVRGPTALYSTYYRTDREASSNALALVWLRRTATLLQSTLAADGESAGAGATAILGQRSEAWRRSLDVCFRHPDFSAAGLGRWVTGCGGAWLRRRLNLRVLVSGCAIMRRRCSRGDLCLCQPTPQSASRCGPQELLCRGR